MTADGLPEGVAAEELQLSGNSTDGLPEGTHTIVSDVGCGRCGITVSDDARARSVEDDVPQECDGAEDGVSRFCCVDCWTCRICGAWLRRVLWPPESYDGFPCCDTCYYVAKELCPQAQAMLLDCDKIKPTFSIWGAKEKNPAPPILQPAEVCPGLFVGDFQDANDVAAMVSRNILAVLDLSQYGDWSMTKRLEEAGITHKQFECKDNRRYNIVAEVFPAAFEFIDAQMKLGRGVLVNCWAGENRSPAVVVGFLAQRRGMSVLDAFRHVVAVRGSVVNNRFFRYLLVRAQFAPKRRRLRQKTPACDVPWYKPKTPHW